MIANHLFLSSSLSTVYFLGSVVELVDTTDLKSVSLGSMGSSPIIRTIFTMNLENQIINYLDKVVEDHSEIPPHIIQTILEDICGMIKDAEQ